MAEFFGRQHGHVMLGARKLVKSLTDPRLDWFKDATCADAKGETRPAPPCGLDREPERRTRGAAASAGLENKMICVEVGAEANTVSKWRRRFAAHRLDGLLD